jgi:hypothetical protein
MRHQHFIHRLQQSRSKPGVDLERGIDNLSGNLVFSHGAMLNGVSQPHQSLPLRLCAFA